MKDQLPPNWTSQLIVIILLFSVGLTLFPLGYLAEGIQRQSFRPQLAYHEDFQANLTEGNPVISDELGVCNDIQIYEWSVNPSTLIFLCIKNSQNETVLVLPMFYTLNISNYAVLHLYLPVSYYTIEAQRQTNDTVFKCIILAYAIYPMSPPTFYILYSFWVLGVIMIILGIFFTNRFLRRTKEYFS